MNQKVIEFSKYIGSKMVWIRAGKYSEMEVTPFNIHIYCNRNEEDGEVKLLLNDITVIRNISIREYDSLRKKGFAIGTPKQYYITEEELTKYRKA